MPPKPKNPAETDNVLDLSGASAAEAETDGGQQVTTAVIERPPAQTQQPQEPRLHRIRLPKGSRFRSDDDPDAIENYEVEEDLIYDNLVVDRGRDSDGNLTGGDRTETETDPASSSSQVSDDFEYNMEKMPPDKKKRLLDLLVQDNQAYLQEKFPTAALMKEKEELHDKLKKVEEQKDLTQHLLQTLQVSGDDVGKSANLYLKKVALAEKEAIVSKHLAELENMKIDLERTDAKIDRISSGAVSEEDDIENAIATSRKLTGRSKPRAAISAAAANDSSDEDEEEEVFSDAAEVLMATEAVLPPTPPEKSKKTKPKTKKKNVKFVGTDSPEKRTVSPEKEKPKPKAPDPPKPSETPVNSDENLSPGGSVFSNTNSLFGSSPQAAIFLKLKGAKEEAEEILRNDSKSLTNLRDAKDTCQSALKFMEKRAPNLESIAIQEIEEIEDMKQEVKKVVKRLNKKIENAEDKKEEKKKTRSVIPDFYCNPSGFLTWRAEFKQSVKSLSELQKISAAKKAIKTKDEEEREALNQMFSNCTSFKQLEKALTSKYGDLEVLIPLFEKKIENLKHHPVHVREEQKAILTILEFFRLLKAHKQEKKFDNSFYRKTIHKLRQKRRDHLDIRPIKTIVVEVKTKKKEPDSEDETDDEDDVAVKKVVEVDMEDFIARLEDWQSNNFTSINEEALAPPKKEHHGHGGGGGGGHGHGGGGGRREPYKRHGAQTFLTDTRKPTCRLCGKDHFTNKCPSLVGNPKKSVTEKKKILQQKSLCETCLEPKDERHKKNCQYFTHKPTGRTRDRLCHQCDSKLNWWICCYVRPVENPSQSSSAPKIPTIENAATKIEVSEDCDLYEDIRVNGCPPGACVGEAELFSVTSPEGEVSHHIGVHDTWSKSTLFDPSLLNLMSGKKKAVYNLATLNSSTVVEGGKGSLNIQTESGNVDVEGLLVEIPNKFIETVTVKIPKKWREKFNLPENISTCEGRIEAVFGLDAIKKEISPVFMDQVGGVRLSRSRLTGKAIVSGYDPDLMTQGNLDHKPSNDTFFISTNKAEIGDLKHIHQIDRHLLDLLNPAAFSINKLSVCDECTQKPPCVKCKFQLSTRNLKERQEEQLLSESCSYLKDEKRWSADPPLKRKVSELPSYREEVLADTKRFRERLRRNPEGEAIARELDAAVSENLASGKYVFEEDLLKKDPSFADLQDCFSPVNFVHKDSTSTAVRQTHNFSFCRGGNISFNSVQFTGSSLNNKLVYLVLKNRGFLFSLNLDIRRFYNQIAVSRRISSFQKFYWPRDGILGQGELVVVVALVLLFGSVHSQCIANLCKLKTSQMFTDDKEVQDTVADMYTDDCMCQSNVNIKECWTLAQKVIDTLSLGGFTFKTPVPSHHWDPGGDQNPSPSVYDPLASYSGLLPEPPDPDSSPSSQPVHYGNACGHSQNTVSNLSQNAACVAADPDHSMSLPAPAPVTSPDSSPPPHIDQSEADQSEACSPSPPLMTDQCSPSRQPVREIPAPGCTSSFGLNWIADGVDCYTLKLSLNLSKKKRGKKDINQEIYSKEQFESFINEHGLSKRQCLSISHGIFDTLNLFYHVRNQFMFLYRDIIVKMPNLHFDANIDKSMFTDWVKAVGLMLELKELKIPRCAIPRCYKPGQYISLVIYCDGSNLSSISRIYCRVAIDEKMTIFDSNFVQAAVKMAPLGTSSAVRTEFDSCLLSCRQLEFLLQAWQHIDFNEIFFLSDSKVCLGALFSFHAKLKTYYCEKAYEIQELFKRHKVQCKYIKSADNLADQGSKRELEINHCRSRAYWKGNFLHLPSKDWPAQDYQFEASDVEELTSVKMSEVLNYGITVNEHFLTQLLEKSYSFNKIIRIICYVKLAARLLIQRFTKSKKKVNASISDYFDLIQKELYVLASPTMEQCKGLKRQYDIQPDPEDENLMIISRAYASDQQILRKKRYIINSDTLVGKKITAQYHIHMSSVESQLANITDAGLFILRGRKVLSKISESCVVCRKLRHVTLTTMMGPSYTELASNYPIGYFSMADILGPLKFSLNRKTQKVFLFGITCLHSRLTRILPLFKIDSDSILTCIKSAAYLNNGVLVRFLAMDWGRQLVSLKTLDDREYQKVKLETQNLSQLLDENKIKVVLSSPWAKFRQGAIERLFAHVKLTLKRSNLYNVVLRYHQIYHLCHYISYMLNSRPLNLKYANNSLIVLTSNKLLRGECQGFSTFSSLDINLEGRRLYQGLNDLERQLKAWFQLWRKTFLESTRKLIKWTEDSPQKLTLNSIVMITDHQNNENGYFTVGQISNIISPRTFEVRYVKIPPKLNKQNKIIKPAVLDTLTRPINSLIYLFEREEDKIISLDPYSGQNFETLSESNSIEKSNSEKFELSNDESLTASNVVNNLKSTDNHVIENVEDITQDELVNSDQVGQEKSKVKGSVNTLLEHLSKENKESD